jgi:hypothetical protein
MGRPSPYTPAAVEAAGSQPPTSVRLEAIEIVQAIQNLRHDVPLIEGKTTLVRCYLTIPDGSAPVSCRGELRAVRADGAVFAVGSLNATEAAPLPPSGLGPLRKDLALSLNFILPAEACGQGNLVVSLASVSVKDGPPQPPAEDMAGQLTVAFVFAPALRVKLFSIRHALGDPPQVFRPSARDLQLTASWLRRAYPAPDVIVTHATIDSPKPWPFSCNDVNLQLAAIRRQDMANGGDGRTHYFGMVSDANGASFMRGCAADIPDHSAPDTVASGPTGSASFGWDFDGSYADWYTGHELGHTFGRFHPGFCNGNSANDPSFPYPNGSLSDQAGDFVGLDAGDATLGVSMAALPGVTWRDVMTYCENQWMSAYTYAGIHQRLVEEDAASGTPPPAPLAGPRPERAQPEAEPMETGLIHVLASLDLEKRTGRIVQVTPVMRGAASRPTQNSPAVVEVLDAAGLVLNAMPLRIKESTCCEGETHRHGMLDSLLAAPKNAHQVRLRFHGEVADTFTAASMPSERDWLRQRAAVAPELEAPPTPGISYTIQISTDAGRSWETVATGVSQPSFRPDASLYPGVDRVLMRITATNGFSLQTVLRDVSLK